MKKEQSAGAVIFMKKGGKRNYLLLHYQPDKRRKRSFWDYPKGHIEKGESENMAAKREIKEETGLDVKFIDGFRQDIKYYFKVQDNTIFKTVVFFLAETKTDKVVLSPEHVGFKWLPFQKALQSLTFKNGKSTLKKADKFLNKK